ncbi:MAG TPA: hypothetical protein VE973_00350 [Candidatus Limnocylindria bacterium]|nr:hypothetical protein [Candidatus Limnocylindria bacterium]
MNANPQTLPGNYDSRWFIWTIVFLLVTGISLVSYIVLSDTSSSDTPVFTTTVHATTQLNKNVKK